MPQCCECHQQLQRSSFSDSQLDKASDRRRCKGCVAQLFPHAALPKQAAALPPLPLLPAAPAPVPASAGGPSALDDNSDDELFGSWAGGSFGNSTACAPAAASHEEPIVLSSDEEGSAQEAVAKRPTAAAAGAVVVSSDDMSSEGELSPISWREEQERRYRERGGEVIDVDSPAPAPGGSALPNTAPPDAAPHTTPAMAPLPAGLALPGSTRSKSRTARRSRAQAAVAEPTGKAERDLFKDLCNLRQRLTDQVCALLGRRPVRSPKPLK